MHVLFKVDIGLQETGIAWSGLALVNPSVYVPGQGSSDSSKNAGEPSCSGQSNHLGAE